MKKLLMTTALVAVMATPAMADQIVVADTTNVGTPVTSERVEKQVNADGSITETVITETLTPETSVSVMLTSEVSKMDLLRKHDWNGDGAYDHKHTVVTIEGLSPEELDATVGDMNADGRIDMQDLAMYVGDVNGDGYIDVNDYVAKFGSDVVKVDFTYNYPRDYDGTTTYVTSNNKPVIVSDSANVRTAGDAVVIDTRTNSNYSRMNR